MTDRLVTLVVLISLACLAVGTLIGGIYLTAIDKSLPGELIAIGSLSAGAIAGVLSSPYGSSVRISNEADDPVPVDAGVTYIEAAAISFVVCLIVLVIFF